MNAKDAADPRRPPPKHSPEERSADGQTIDQRVRYVLRLLRGETELKVSQETGCSVEALRQWRQLFLEAGTERLAELPAGDVPHVRLELLGHPRAFLGAAAEAEALHWSITRAFLVVAFLALAPGRQASKEELIAALWPEVPSSKIRRNFHPTLSLARRAFSRTAEGSMLVYRGGLYGLSQEAHWAIDVDAFEGGVAAGIEAAEEAPCDAVYRRLCDIRAYYRGPLLEGFEGSWIDPRRQQLRGLYLRLLRVLGELAASLGREDDALDHYRFLLLEEPFEEQVHVRIMEIYGRRGRRDLVRRQFVKLQALLKELGVEPGERAQERYHALMR